jgi:hypothetical protein
MRLPLLSTMSGKNVTGSWSEACQHDHEHRLDRNQRRNRCSHLPPTVPEPSHAGYNSNTTRSVLAATNSTIFSATFNKRMRKLAKKYLTNHRPSSSRFPFDLSSMNLR